MKIHHYNYSDSGGGASRAAMRLHLSLIKKGIDSYLYVNKSNISNNNIVRRTSFLGKLDEIMEYRDRLGKVLVRLLTTENKILHSPGLIPSCKNSTINKSNADIVNLHWINHEMISIRDIAKINKPIVWTLHDMWAFCGCEHISYDKRYSTGYNSENKPKTDMGLDINKFVWQYKKHNWKKPMTIITPSKWMAKCVKESVLMKDWPIKVIHNPIDTDYWCPINEKSTLKKILGISENIPVLLFGGANGGLEYHKGHDLLVSALEILKQKKFKLQIIMIGGKQNDDKEYMGFKCHMLGRVHDDLSLKIIYNVADALVIPSRIDNLPNMGVEGMSCGLPVIAFDTCGLPDIVEHKINGYLAKPFEPKGLADGLELVLSSILKNNRYYTDLSINARKSAINKFSYDKVASDYINVYEKILNNKIT